MNELGYEDEIEELWSYVENVIVPFLKDELEKIARKNKTKEQIRAEAWLKLMNAILEQPIPWVNKCAYLTFYDNTPGSNMIYSKDLIFIGPVILTDSYWGKIGLCSR